MPCRLSWSGVDIIALTRDVSHGGMALSLSDNTEGTIRIREKGHLHISKQITLQLVAIHLRREPARLVAGFQIVTIEEGAEQWKDLVDR
jgi:uncharacterized lipoprotein YbaY